MGNYESQSPWNSESMELRVCSRLGLTIVVCFYGHSKLSQFEKEDLQFKKVKNQYMIQVS